MSATERMVALLGRMRCERNGAVADAMRCYGRMCGLNYGVSLPTVRQIARTESPDADLAHLLWEQDVRELRLAALHVMPVERMTAEECDRWAEGIINSELAEEAAFALFGKLDDFQAFYHMWIARSDAPLLPYTALMAAARHPQSDTSCIPPALRAVATAPEEYARLTAQGVIVLCEALAGRQPQSAQAIFEALQDNTLPALPAFDLIREEIAWLLPR